MTRKAKRRTPRTGVALDPTDRAAAKDVAETNWKETETLKRHGLGVRAVVGNTVTWHREPTEAEQAMAAQLLGRILAHGV